MNKMTWMVTVWLFAVLFIFTSGPVLAESQGAVNLGIVGGVAAGGMEAVKGYSQTEFGSGPVYGGSLMYRFANGFALELLAVRHTMELTENSDSFGKLQLTPVVLLFKGQSVPPKGSGIGWHWDIGGGVALSSFEKGSFITNLERTYGVNITVDTKNGYAVVMGGGGDIFFTKNISLAIDLKYFMCYMGTTWKASGSGGTVNFDTIDRFDASNIQLLATLRGWMW